MYLIKFENPSCKRENNLADEECFQMTALVREGRADSVIHKYY